MDQKVFQLTLQQDARADTQTLRVHRSWTQQGSPLLPWLVREGFDVNPTLRTLASAHCRCCWLQRARSEDAKADNTGACRQWIHYAAVDTWISGPVGAHRWRIQEYQAHLQPNGRQPWQYPPTHHELLAESDSASSARYRSGEILVSVLGHAQIPRQHPIELAQAGGLAGQSTDAVWRVDHHR